jgi:hypothetical protein
VANRGNQDDPNRRATKAERKEEARRERERIQQQMKARSRNRTIGLVLIALAVVVVLVVVFVVQPGKSGAPPSPESLLADAAGAAKTAGCSAIQQTKNYDDAPGDDPTIDHTHIGDASMPTAPPLSSYPTVPAASGPHDPTPWPAGVYPTPVDPYRAIHSLEHAGVVIWYAPSAANSDEVKQIQAFYSQPVAGDQGVDVGQAKVIVSPNHFPDQGSAGELPSGVQMAVVAWHRLQTCATPSLAVAFNFSSQYVFPPAANRKYVGVAREPNNSM